MKRLILIPLLLTGCAAQSKIEPEKIVQEVLQQKQVLLAVVQAHNTLATCLKDNDSVKAIKECVAKAYEKKGEPKK